MGLVPWTVGICLYCRMALPPRAACEGGTHHPVVDLETPDGRNAYLQALWGNPARRDRLRVLLRAGATGSGIGAVATWLDCGGVPEAGSLDAILLGVLLVAGLFMLAAYVAGKIGDARRRRRLLRPFGVPDRRPLVSLRGARVGTAVGAAEPSPLREQPCLAHQIVLRTTRAAALSGDVLWREANTAGFTLRLDNGDTVQIPMGRVRLVGLPERAWRTSRARAAARLPARLGVDVEGELSDMPFDEAFEEVVLPNDRIALLTGVAHREDPNQPRASPRAPAHVVAIATGVPVIAYGL